MIDWLACLVDLVFDPSWPLERRRALVAEAMALYRTRGTVRGLERYIEIYTGMRPVILEGFLTRSAGPRSWAAPARSRVLSSSSAPPRPSRHPKTRSAALGHIASPS